MEIPHTRPWVGWLRRDPVTGKPVSPRPAWEVRQELQALFADGFPEIVFDFSGVPYYTRESVGQLVEAIGWMTEEDFPRVTLWGCTPQVLSSMKRAWILGQIHMNRVRFVQEDDA
jgi:hypothetical protein